MAVLSQSVVCPAIYRCHYALVHGVRKVSRVTKYRQGRTVLTAVGGSSGPVAADVSMLPFPDRSVRLGRILPLVCHKGAVYTSPPAHATRFAVSAVVQLDSSQAIHLPSLAHCKLYINLTNGLEALPLVEAYGIPCTFLRLQSTTCEQQNLEGLVAQLDVDLLLHLALGRCCIVVDFGSRNKKRGAPRALWMGACVQKCSILAYATDQPPCFTNLNCARRLGVRALRAHPALAGTTGAGLLARHQHNGRL